MDNKPHILSTATLPQPLLDTAKDAGINVDVLPFIKIQKRNDEISREGVNKTADKAVVFSSKNAVEAVAEMLDTKPDWAIYCVGNSTAELANSYFGGKVKEVANDGGSLAKKILENQEIKGLTFFCGDIRRDELPELLRQGGVTVNEAVVYTTTVMPHRMEKEYDAILFFSPSAVESFFLANKLDNSTVLFAIGATTANAIAGKTGNAVMVCEQAGKGQLVADMIRYYSTINKTIS